MNKIWLVLRNEIINQIARKSFFLVTFGVPLISALIFGAVSWLRSNDQSGSVMTSIVGSAPTAKVEGYVDASGIVKSIPTTISPGSLVAYPDEKAAAAALNAGQIAAYYVVPKDYLKSGKLLYVRADFNPLNAFDQAAGFEEVLSANLLGDEHLAEQVNHPLILERISRAPTPERDSANPLTFLLPYVTTLLFYIVILGNASMMLSSVVKEKENRLIEILMVSVSPVQMLTGKIVGLGIVGLVQMVLWVTTGYGLLRLGGKTLSLPAAFQLPISFVVWAIVFFLLGYLLYGALMAGLGALVPSLKEASQVTIVVMLPMMIPLFFISLMIEDPHGALAVTLSLFPLTAPVAMMTRLAAGGVPWWQPPLAAGLVIMTAGLAIRSVAGLFRAQTLLSGQAFHLKRFLGALAGKG